MTTQKTITRFAPSPSGLLHLGHAYSALFAEKEAKDQNGTFLLRFEDIDLKRCHEKYENKIIEDLNWLNIYYQGPIRRQSEHMHDYIAAIEKLTALKLAWLVVRSNISSSSSSSSSSSKRHGSIKKCHLQASVESIFHFFEKYICEIYVIF